jgi:hypothetical protein
MEIVDRIKASQKEYSLLFLYLNHIQVQDSNRLNVKKPESQKLQENQVNTRIDGDLQQKW